MSSVRLRSNQIPWWVNSSKSGRYKVQVSLAHLFQDLADQEHLNSEFASKEIDGILEVTMVWKILNSVSIMRSNSTYLEHYHVQQVWRLWSAPLRLSLRYFQHRVENRGLQIANTSPVPCSRSTLPYNISTKHQPGTLRSQEFLQLVLWDIF